MGRTSRSDKITISIRDLFLYILSRWRVLIVGLLIGAVVLGAYGVYKNFKQAETVEIGELEERAEAALKSMSASELAVSERAAGSIIRYLERYAYYRNYLEKSVFQHLDAGSLKVNFLTYVADGVDITSDTDLSGVVRTYANGIIGDKLAEETSKEFGCDIEDAYYYYESIVYCDINNASGGTLVVSIYGNDDEFISRMTKVVKAVADDITAEGKTEFPLVLTGEAMTKRNDSNIYDKQNNNSKVFAEIEGKISDEKAALNSAQLVYAQYIVTRDYDGQYLELAFSGETAGDEQASGPVIKLNRKMIVVGLAAGLVIAAVIIMIKYLASGRLRYYDDLEYMYGFNIIGTYSDPEAAEKRKKTGLDKWLWFKRIRRKPDSLEEGTARIAARLDALAKNQNIKKICIAAGPEVFAGEDFMKNVAQKAKFAEIETARDILNDADSMGKIFAAEGVVFLEQMDMSRFASIDAEIGLCESNNVNVLGAVVAE